MITNVRFCAKYHVDNYVVISCRLHRVKQNHIRKKRDLRHFQAL